MFINFPIFIYKYLKSPGQTYTKKRKACTCPHTSCKSIRHGDALPHPIYLYDISSIKDLTRLQMLHPVFLLILSGISRSVTTSIPGLDAYKRSILCRRRPQPNYRCIKMQCKNRLPLAIIQRNFFHLAVFQYQGILIKRMNVQRQQTVAQCQG